MESILIDEIQLIFFVIEGQNLGLWTHFHESESSNDWGSYSHFDKHGKWDFAHSYDLFLLDRTYSGEGDTNFPAKMLQKGSAVRYFTHIFLILPAQHCLCTHR